jgi:hypothetical protein
MIFLNLGLAFWLGDILGKTYFGFFVVAAFYILAGSIFYIFFSKRLKRYICNSLIQQMLKYGRKIKEDSFFTLEFLGPKFLIYLIVIVG